MKRITIIIPFLNEGDELNNTVNSIYETANPDDFEIILIDDVSFDNIDFNRFDKYKEVTYVRNEIRIGVDGCRDIGINMTKTPYVLIIDAHMRFTNDDWLNKIVSELEKDPKLLLCTKSGILNEDNPNEWMDKDGYNNCGVKIYPFFIPKDNIDERCIFEPRWMKIQNDKGYLYEVPCIMGANYASSVEWLKYIKGFKGLIQWGGSEQFISLKTWLAGGSVKVLTTVIIGHLYKVKLKQKFSVTNIFTLYNSLLIAYVLFDDKITFAFLDFCLKDSRYKNSIKLLNENILELDKDRKYYKSIFINDINFLKSKGIDINYEKYMEYSVLYDERNALLNRIDSEESKLKEYQRQLDEIPTLNVTEERKQNLINNLKPRFPLINDNILKSKNRISEIDLEIEKYLNKYDIKR